MTTIVLNGVRVTYDEHDNASSVSSVSAEIVLPQNSSGTFSYTITGFDDGLPLIELNEDASEIRLDGETLAALGDTYDVQPVILRVQWSGGATTIVAVDLEPLDGGNNSELYFVLDGPVPNIQNLDDWAAFDAAITGVGAPTGRFAEGQDIAWTSFVTSTTTEEDEFYGTSGDDTFVGGAGENYFFATEGNDSYSGGSDHDRVIYASSPAGVVVDLAAGTATDGWGDIDTLNGIEQVNGSAYADVIIGNNSDNEIRAFAGNDTLDGGRGTDTVKYDRDARLGGEAGVTINLKKGFAIDGFGDRDQLSGFEVAVGTESKDTFLGGGKGEVLRGLGGNDAMNGGGGNDFLDAGEGNDRLLGGSGKDSLSGGAGKDKLEGGSGDDILIGGDGADRFIFKGNFGNDAITDFNTAGSKEKIDLRQISEIKSFRDLINNHAEEDQSGNVVIHDGEGNSIYLNDVSLSDLSANDFLF